MNRVVLFAEEWLDVFKEPYAAFVGAVHSLQDLQWVGRGLVVAVRGLRSRGADLRAILADVRAAMVA